MSTENRKGPITVSNTAELRTALTAGYKSDEILVADASTQVAAAREEGRQAGLVTGRAEGAEAARAEGLKAGREEGRIAGVAEGAAAERARIQGVQQTVLPGHEALVQTLMFDGKTTPGEAAGQVVTAERQKRGQRVENLGADAAAAAARAAAAPATGTEKPDAGKKPDVDPNMPLEERCKALWASDPDIRAEFGTVEEYIAFEKATASGQARIFHGKQK